MENNPKEKVTDPEIPKSDDGEVNQTVCSSGLRVKRTILNQCDDNELQTLLQEAGELQMKTEIKLNKYTALLQQARELHEEVEEEIKTVKALTIGTEGDKIEVGLQQNEDEKENSPKPHRFKNKVTPVVVDLESSAGIQTVRGTKETGVHTEKFEKKKKEGRPVRFIRRLAGLLRSCFSG